MYKFSWYIYIRWIKIDTNYTFYKVKERSHVPQFAQDAKCFSSLTLRCQNDHVTHAPVLPDFAQTVKSWSDSSENSGTADAWELNNISNYLDVIWS